MALATITGTERTTAGALLAGVQITLQLVPSEQTVFDTASEIFGEALTTTSAADGTWSLSAERTDTMTPGGMVYQLTRFDPASQTPRVDYVALRAGGGRWDTLLTSQPGALPDTFSIPNLDFPENHGAVGDGLTDDVLALRASLATGKPIWLNPAKTYLSSGGLTVQAGQVLYGNGATIKVANQVLTTTSTPIVANTTNVIVVGSAAGLAVGMDLVYVNGGSFDTGPRTIQSIVGTTVTFTTAIGVSGSGAATLYSTTYLVTLSADAAVRDLIINGNRANASFYRWQVTAGICAAGDRSLVDHCYLHDLPGEGVMMMTGNYTKLRHTTVNTANGNGVHLSGTTFPLVEGCSIINTNLDTSVGHADGCITWSNGIGDGTVTGCYLGPSPLAGIGSLDSTPGNDSVTITGNTIRSCAANAIIAYASDGTGPSSRVVIDDNRIYACGQVLLSQSGSGPPFPSRFIITDNYLSATALSVARGRNVTIHGNIFDFTSDTTSTVIELDLCQWLDFTGNQVIGGQYGMLLSGTSLAVTVADNTWAGQNTFAINAYNANLASSRFTGNMVTNDSTAASGYYGIRIASPAQIADNYVSLTKGGGGILLVGNNTQCHDNVVRQGAASNTIQVGGGVTGALVKDNMVTAAVTDSGTGTTLTGNVVIS